MSENKKVNKVYNKEEIVDAIQESMATYGLTLHASSAEKIAIADMLAKKLNLDIKEEYPENVVWDSITSCIRDVDGSLLLVSKKAYGPEFVRRWNAVSRALNLITIDTGANNDRLVVTLFGVLKGEY